MKTLDQHIEEVMDWFDFDKVHKYMESTNWIWAREGIDSVPEKAELRKSVREEMGKLYHEKGDKVNGERSYFSGGFLINYYWGEDKDGQWDHYSVNFVISRWSTSE